MSTSLINPVKAVCHIALADRSKTKINAGKKNRGISEEIQELNSKEVALHRLLQSLRKMQMRLLLRLRKRMILVFYQSPVS